VSAKKVNASEPPMRRRKDKMMSKPRYNSTEGQAERLPVYWLCDIRRIGGTSLAQASEGNVRTCRHNVKGKPQVEDTARGKVPMCGTGAEHFVVVLKFL